MNKKIYMKHVISLVIFFLIGINIMAQESISFIKSEGSWHYVYDEKGKKITTMSKSSAGEVQGWGADFFVTKNGSWYYLYDMKGRKYKTLSKSTIGEVVSVSSTTFTSQNGSWYYIFDRDGKKIKTMSR